MKRTPLVRKSGLARGTFTRKPTKSREWFNLELDAITPDLVIRAEWRCEGMIEGVCSTRGDLHRHHRRSRRVRKDGKANTLDNLLLLCRSCHAYIHDNPKWARQCGFILPTNCDPEKQPVRRDLM